MYVDKFLGTDAQCKLLDGLLEEVNRRLAALTILLSVTDDTGVSVMAPLLRKTLVAASTALSRYDSGSNVDLVATSLRLALSRASALITTSISKRREIDFARAARWLQRIQDVAQSTGELSRSSGPDLFEVKRSGCRLAGADFVDLHVEACAFNGASLQRASFDRARFVGCLFQDADLRGVTLDGAAFSDCNFYGADFSAVPTARVEQNVFFSGSILTDANFHGRLLSGAVIVNCEVEGIRGYPIPIECNV